MLHLQLSCTVHITSCHPQSQEKEARDEMKRKAKELEMARREERKTGRKAYTGGFGGGGGGYGGSMRGTAVDPMPSHDNLPKAYNPPS